MKLIGNEIVPFALIDCEGRNEELVKVLREKGFFAVIQKHLDEDWCQTKFVKICIGKTLTEEKMREVIDVLAAF